MKKSIICLAYGKERVQLQKEDQKGQCSTTIVSTFLKQYNTNNV